MTLDKKDCEFKCKHSYDQPLAQDSCLRVNILRRKFDYTQLTHHKMSF